MQEFWYDFITAVLTTIAVVGSFANLAVIIVVARNSKVFFFCSVHIENNILYAIQLYSHQANLLSFFFFK